MLGVAPLIANLNWDRAVSGLQAKVPSFAYTEADDWDLSVRDVDSALFTASFGSTDRFVTKLVKVVKTRLEAVEREGREFTPAEREELEVLTQLLVRAVRARSGHGHSPSTTPRVRAGAVDEHANRIEQKGSTDSKLSKKIRRWKARG